MKKIFDTRNIIILKIQEQDLNSFLLSMDIDDNNNPNYPIDEFVNILTNAIPEFVFAQQKGNTIDITEINKLMREAALSIYKFNDISLMYECYVNKNKDACSKINTLPIYKRGEFGELLLHVLLRDFHGTIPLISKIYFKDTTNVPAHGFDAVHITPNKNILWLGESKLYADSKSGIKELIKDIDNHIKKDFLNEQFAIITKNLDNSKHTERDKWIEKLEQCTQLKEIVKMINIPLLCTYEHDIYDKFTDLDSIEANKYHVNNINEIKQYFYSNYNHKLKNKLNIILLLFPIRNKKEFLENLYKKLYFLQNR